MRDSRLALDVNRDNRALYSWRHTDVTLEMLGGEVDIHCSPVSRTSRPWTEKIKSPGALADRVLPIGRQWSL
jgi:hypothetical protein